MSDATKTQSGRLIRSVAIACCSLVFPTGCGKKEGMEGTGGTFAFETRGEPSILTLTVESRWEKSSFKTLHQRCEIPKSAPLGTVLECDVTVPEAQLYYSDLILSLETDPLGPGERMTFHPYYYIASRSPEFIPFWSDNDTKINCFGEADVPFTFKKIPKDCFNGPAPHIIDGWPTYTGVYHLVKGSHILTKEIPAANSIRRRTNRWTSNSLDPAFRGRDLDLGGDGYVSNSMKDYSFALDDKWGEPLYAITLTIKDEDFQTGGSGDNHYSGWNGLFQ